MNKISTMVASVLIVCLLLPLSVLADSHEERGGLADVWLMKIKDGMENEFVAAAKEHMAMRAAKGDSRKWEGYRSVIGDHVNLIQFRACCYDWAELDGYDKESIEKGFDEHWGENVGQYVDHYHHYLETMDWENSHWPDGERTAGPYYGVTSWTYKMGGGSATGDAMKEMSRIAKEVGWGDDNEWLWHSRVGGKPMLMIVNSNASYAEMAPPEKSFFEAVSEHLGSDEAAQAMFDQFSSGLAGSSYTIWMSDEDLTDPRDE